jgi:hypothetical protein
MSVETAVKVPVTILDESSIGHEPPMSPLVEAREVQTLAARLSILEGVPVRIEGIDLSAKALGSESAAWLGSQRGLQGVQLNHNSVGQQFVAAKVERTRCPDLHQRPMICQSYLGSISLRPGLL